MLAVLVNGLPGAGKSTLAPLLAAELGLPLFHKDSVKETLADFLGVRPPDGRAQASWNRDLGAATMETLWTLLGLSNRGAVLETPLLPPVEHFVRAGLARAGVAPQDLHEVWCEVPPALARDRFDARAATRHPIHGDDLDKSADWALWIREARPLTLGHVYRVDTTIPVQQETIASIAARILATATAGGAAGARGVAGVGAGGAADRDVESALARGIAAAAPAAPK